MTTTEDSRDLTETAAFHANDTLAARHFNLSRTIAVAQEERDRIEFELTRRMEADDATVLGVKDYEVSIDYKYTWDHSRLAALREIIAPEDLEDIYTPEHDEMVHKPETWRMVAGQHLGKYGKEAQAVLDRARIRGAGKLRVAPKGVF